MKSRHLDERKKLGLNIAYYRKFKGLSQNVLSEKIDISRTHMSRIETAECSVSINVLFDICETLEITPKDLFDLK